MRKFARVGAVVAGAGIAVMVAAGTASAFTLSPVPDGNRVEFNRAETEFISNTDLANMVISTVYPHIVEAQTREPFGPYAQRSFNRAMATPTGVVAVNVYGSPTAPYNIKMQVSR